MWLPETWFKMHKLTRKLKIQTKLRKKKQCRIETKKPRPGNGFQNFEDKRKSERLVESNDEGMAAETNTIMY